MYRYQIYGLKIESEYEIEEALSLHTDEKTEVTICRGIMPEEISDKVRQLKPRSFHMMNTEDSLFFSIEDVGAYLVTREQILVEEKPGVDFGELKCFLLGTALGFSMTLRGMLAIHGGAVAKPGHPGIIVTGESGAGKSTVSHALRSRGYDFIADDVCALSFREGLTYINLAYPQQKLCRDAALKMGYDLENLIYLDEERDKFALRLQDGYLPEGAPFGYLFELGMTDEAGLSIQEVKGHEKVLALIRNIYRGEFSLKMWGLPPEMMKSCAVIASQIQVYRIFRPKDKDTLEEIVTFIESKM